MVICIVSIMFSIHVFIGDASLTRSEFCDTLQSSLSTITMAELMAKNIADKFSTKFADAFCSIKFKIKRFFNKDRQYNCMEGKVNQTASVENPSSEVQTTLMKREDALVKQSATNIRIFRSFGIYLIVVAAIGLLVLPFAILLGPTTIAFNIIFYGFLAVITGFVVGGNFLQAAESTKKAMPVH